MRLYDLVAPAYDIAFESIYQPFRSQALKRLPNKTVTTTLDLACGTGQNFPFLTERVGGQGRIVGVDISRGMLKRARLRADQLGLHQTKLLYLDAAELSPSLLEAETGLSSVDSIICTYSFTSMRNWEAAFRVSWDMLKPGGTYLIHDIDAVQRTFHVRAVETITHSNFCDKVWRPLQALAPDFRMDYLDPSAHLFGGRLFVATGTKPP
jgi:ubiquinone/menaquinone biosynthesis C-methylase UbiE